MTSWVHQHWWPVFVAAVLALVFCTAVIVQWARSEARQPLEDDPEYLPGPAVHALNGEQVRPAGEFHDEWERLDPDQAADQLIAEWHDDPGAPVTGDVWDQWWEGVDGLERECMLVHDWLVREERLWAELKAETREMCAA